MGVSMSSLFNYSALVIGTLTCAGLFALWTYQNNILYIPKVPSLPSRTDENPEGYRNPGEFQLPYEDVYIDVSKGREGLHQKKVKIHAWLIKQSVASSAPTVVFFHGNAGNIGFRLPNFVKLYYNVRCNVLAVDYRGYGNSDGRPDEAALKSDAQVVLDWLRSREDVDQDKIFVFGRSLGGAVALDLVHRNQSAVRGVIVENTFLSIPKMVDALFGVLSYAKWLILRIDWNNERCVKQLSTAPILFLSSRRDEIVPREHMEGLFTMCTAKHKWWWQHPRGMHNDLYEIGGPKYFEIFKNFVNQPSVDPVQTDQ